MGKSIAMTFPLQPAKAGFPVEQGRVRPLLVQWHGPGKTVIVRLFAESLGPHLGIRDEGGRPTASPAPGNTESDGSLLALTASGDLGAFSRIVDRHQAMLLAVADRMMAGHGEGDDIAQEALLRLWRSAGQLDIGEAGAGPWLRRVVSNLCIDRLRVQGRLAPMDDAVPEPSEPPSQLSGLAGRQTAARMEQAMQALPDRQRLALALFHYEELSLLDIAGRLALTVDAVESLLARGRRTLRKQLEADWRSLLDDNS